MKIDLDFVNLAQQEYLFTQQVVPKCILSERPYSSHPARLSLDLTDLNSHKSCPTTVKFVSSLTLVSPNEYILG